MMQEEVEEKKMEPEAASTFVIGEPPLQEENNGMVATLSQSIITEPPQYVEDERHGSNGVALDASNDGVLGAEDDGNDGNEDVRQVALSEQPQSTKSQSRFEFLHQGNGDEQEMPPASVLSTTIAQDNDDFDDFIAVAADANHQNDDVIIGGQSIVGLASNVSVSKSPSPIDEGGDKALRQDPLPVEVESVVASRIPLAAAPLSSSPHLIQAIHKKEDDEFGDFDEAPSTTTSLDLVEGHGQQQEMELHDVTGEKEMESIPPSHKMPSSISPPLLADHDGSFVELDVVNTSSIKKEGVVPDAMDDALSTGAVTNAPSKDDNDLIAVLPSSVTATDTGLNSPAALEEVSLSSSPSPLPPITREADVEQDELQQQQQHEEEKERDEGGKKEHETEDDFGNFEEWQASPPSGTKGARLDHSHEQQEEVHRASSSVARLGDAHSSSVEGPSDQALDDDDGGDQPDDDWGDFNEAPQFASSVSSPPPPMDPLVSPSTAVSAESLSSSPALTPTKPTENGATFGEQGWKSVSKRVGGFFEEAYGPPSHQAEHLPGISLPAVKKAHSLDENLDRNLPLGRYFEAHASKWAVKTLTEELMRSLRNDGTHGEEEGDEKEESVISITWALASPAPSRPVSSVCHQSVDLHPTSQAFGFASGGGKEKKEHHDASLTKTDRLIPQLASADSSGSIDSPTDLDFDLLGGGGGGGAEAGRNSRIGKGSSSRPSPDHLSRAFLDIGLEGRPSSRTNGRRGGKASEKDDAAAKSPDERQQQQEVNSSSPTKAVRNARKGPLSASAETFVNIIPDWTYMRARLPQLPHNLNSS